jgi:hypothetical protein
MRFCHSDIGRHEMPARGDAWMKSNLHVISVGSADECNTIRDALLQRHHSRLSVAASPLALGAIPKQESFDIAVLLNTLSRRGLRNASEYIRHRWPQAKILVISAEAEILDDPLYDESVLPGLPPESLLATIAQLTGKQ